MADSARARWRSVRWFLFGVGVVVAGAVGAAVPQALGAPAWLVVLTAGVAAALSLAGQFVWPAHTAREQAGTAHWDAWTAAVDQWPWDRPAPEPTHPASRLLDARHQVTPFRYRRRALAVLADWCAGGVNPVHLLLGPAGVGKTRLAVALSEELPDGWTIGSAYPDHEGAAVRAARDLPGQVLVVVDHADTRTDLTDAVREVVRPGAEHVRLLLIARSEEPDQWWYQAFTAVRSTARADELDATGRTVLGPVVHTRDDQDQLFTQAVDAFAHRIGVRTPGVHMGHVEPDAPILMIQAAALVAVLRPPGRPVNVDDTLWRELSEHETGVWQAAAHRLHLDLLADTQRRIVAWAALLGGQDEDTVIGWLGRMADLGDADRDRLHRIAEWLHALYPGTSPTWLTVVEPSMLADHLVVDELTRGSALADSMLGALDTGQVARMLHLLGRVAVTEPSVRALVERMLRAAPGQVIPAACQVTSGVVPLDPMIAACVADPTVDLTPDFLDTLWRSLPDPDETVLLRWTVVAVARRRADGTDDVDRLTDLAAACTSVGEWREALTAAIRAVGAGRLALDRTASLARALRVRCRTERSMRRMPEAQAAGSESVALLRKLADADRSAYQVELASSLCRLADAQRYAGELDAALANGREAVRLLREAGTDRARLATALRVLGIAERTAGHFDEGRIAGQESVDLWRELADARPDAYRSELAHALDCLAAAERHCQHQDEFLAAAVAAAALFREVAATGIGPFRHCLGDALATVAVAEREAGHRDQALAAGRESVHILRELNETDPDAYRQCLGDVLGTHASNAWECGHTAEALAAGRESVDILRELADAHPAAYRSWLSDSLNALAHIELAAGQPDEALASNTESVALWRSLAKARPDAYQRWLAEVLLTRAYIQLSRSEITEAREAVSEAVRELNALVRRSPSDAARSALARAEQLRSAITPPEKFTQRVP